MASTYSGVREFIVRLDGTSDGFTRAVNSAATGVGRLTSFLANLARQAQVALPALALKTTALTLLAAGFRQAYTAAVESFEGIETEMVRLEQTTTMRAGRINRNLQSAFTISRKTGVGMESLMGAWSEAYRHGDTAQGGLLGAQAGSMMSLIMGGTPAQWAGVGAQGGAQYGLDTEQYLDMVLHAHQRGRTPEWVDAQLEAGRNLDHAAGTLRDAAALLVGSREFEGRRADVAWEQVGQKWGAAIERWGFSPPAWSNMKYNVSRALAAPASGIYNMAQNVDDAGWRSAIMGWISPNPSGANRQRTLEERQAAADWAQQRGYDAPNVYRGPDGQEIEVFGSPAMYGSFRHWTTGGEAPSYGPGSYVTEDGQMSTREEAAAAYSRTDNAIRAARRAQARRAYRGYGESVLSGTDRSDRQRLLDAMRTNAIRAEELAAETAKAKAAMASVASETQNAASGMASMARLVGIQGGMASFGVMGQLETLKQTFGPGLADALTLMKGLSPQQLIDQARGMVERSYGTRVAEQIDWSQFTPSTGGGGGVTPIAPSPQQSVVIPLESQQAYRAVRDAQYAAGGGGRVAAPLSVTAG